MTSRRLLVGTLLVGILVAMAGFAAGGATYGLFFDSETASGTIQAAEQFSTFPSDAVAYDDSNPENGQYDDVETTYTATDLENLEGDQRLRFTNTITAVESDGIGTDTQDFITDAPLSFVIDGVFNVQTSELMRVQNGDIEASTITVEGDGTTDLNRTSMEATTVTLTNGGQGILFANAIIEADEGVQIEGTGSPILGQDVDIEAGRSVQISASGKTIDLNDSSITGSSITISTSGKSVYLRNAELETAGSIRITSHGGTVDLRGASCEANSIQVTAKTKLGSC